MGNIGYSQGLDRIVDAFQESSELDALNAELIIAGHRVAAADVRAPVPGTTTGCRCPACSMASSSRACAEKRLDRTW